MIGKIGMDKVIQHRRKPKHTWYIFKLLMCVNYPELYHVHRRASCEYFYVKGSEGVKCSLLLSFLWNMPSIFK